MKSYLCARGRARSGVTYSDFGGIMANGRANSSRPPPGSFRHQAKIRGVKDVTCSENPLHPLQC